MQWAADDVPDDPSEISKLSPDLQRVVQSATTQGQSAGPDVVTGIDILVELFTEPVGHFLQEQGATRYAALIYLSHGVAKTAKFARTGLAGRRPASEGIIPQDTGDVGPREVMLLNDPYTPMEFVVFVLQEIFQFDREMAIGIILSINKTGRGSCGAYERAKAIELADRVEDLMARTFPHIPFER